MVEEKKKGNRAGGRPAPVFNKTAQMKQKILEAWKAGDRSFDDVVRITGYTPTQVGYYLPPQCGLKKRRRNEL